MASNVNPNNIDQDYPTAGQDNDSQGFRDNFTNIKTNFENTKDELEDLQNKVLLKSALTGGTLDNDLNGEIIKSALMQDARSVKFTGGPASASTSIDVQAATYYTFSTDGQIDLDFINWPAAGQHSKVYVEITVTDVGHAIFLPTSITVGTAGIQNLGTDDKIYYSELGTYIYEFSSSDAGTSIAINELTRGRNDFWRTITTSIGTPGDRQGMIAFDTDYIYCCIADYDGVSHVWTRIAQSSGVTW